MEVTRNKEKNEEILAGKRTAAPEKDPMEGYVPKELPRKEYGEEEENGRRIRSNLSRINKRYVATPYGSRKKTDTETMPEGASVGAVRRRATRIPTTRAENAAIARRRVNTAVRTNVEVIDQKNTARKPFPFAVIICCVALTAMFMYMISLYIQIDDYSDSISGLKGEISRLNDDIVSLDLRLQGKYDLDEIERIAVEEYGMVRSDSLPKKYISLAGEDVVEVTDPGESNGLGNLLSVFAALLGFGD